MRFTPEQISSHEDLLGMGSPAAKPGLERRAAVDSENGFKASADDANESLKAQSERDTGLV
jgi:hypothetical protein